MNSNKKLVIACDFDGTIVEHDYPIIGALKPEAKETINKWYNDGHKIIIWSCRSDEKTIREAIEFLNKNGIKFHSFNLNPEPNDDFNPFPKIFAHAYIDDRGIRFDDKYMNWGHLGKIIK